MCTLHQRMGLIDFLTFDYGYSEELVLQLSATVHFDRYDARTFHWMTGNRKCQASMSQFSEITCYPLHITSNDGYTPVADEVNRTKDVLSLFAIPPIRSLFLGT